MNREIKFRAYHHLTKKIINPEEVSNKTLGKNPIEWHNERKWTLMQYTGLKDKNGKEIYEGDIVSIEYGKGVVEYSEKQAMFIINWIGDNEAYNESLAYNPRNYIYGKTRKDIEVIGNIYENPEFTQTSE